MFCGKCGNKIDDNVMFCPVCGEKTAYVPISPAGTDTPVRSDAAPAADNTVSLSKENQAPQFVNEAVPAADASSVSDAPGTSDVTAGNTVNAGNAVNAVNAVYAVNAGNAEPSVQHVQPESGYNGYQYTGENAAPVYAPPVKKKSKAGLIAGIAAAAVVVGGAGVGYAVFKNDITRMTMGDTEYAKMIDKNAAEAASKSEVINTAEDAAAKISGSPANGIVTTAVSSLVGYGARASSVNAEKSNSSESGLMPIASSAAQSLGSAVSMLPSSSFGSDPQEILSSVLDAIPEGKTVSSTANVDVELGSVFALFKGTEVDSVIDLINELTVKTSLSRKDGNNKITAALADEKGNIGALDIYTDKDGDLTAAFPGISDKTFLLTKAQLDEMISDMMPGYGSADDEDETKAQPALTKDDIDRLSQALKDVYYECYENASITYGKNDTFSLAAKSGSAVIAAEVKGNETVTVTWDSEQLTAMINKMLAVIRDDPALKQIILSKLDVEEEKYSELFKDIEKEKIDFSFSVMHITDADNKVLASRYSVLKNDNSEYIQFDAVNSDSRTLFGLTCHMAENEDKEAEDIFSAQFGLDKKSESDGTALMCLSSSKYGGVSFGVQCSYSGKGTGEWLGKQVPVGSYTISFPDPEGFEDCLKKLTQKDSADDKTERKYTDENNEQYAADTMALSELTQDNMLTQLFGKNGEKLFGELKKLELNVNMTLDKGYTSGIRLSLGNIGTLSITAASELTDADIVLPDKSAAILKDDRASMDDLSIDTARWLREFIKRSPLLEAKLAPALDSSIEEYEKKKVFKKHYADYTGSAVWKADGAASDVYDALNDKLYEALSDKENEVTDGVIKLYCKDGKYEVIDSAGLPEMIPENAVIDNAYIEIYFNKYANDGITGVTAVLTDDKNDLPDSLPNIFNYVDRVYPWEDEANYIGEYVVGTYPDLEQGTPVTSEIAVPEQVRGGVSPEDITLDSFDGLWNVTVMDGQDLTSEPGSYLQFSISGDKFIIGYAEDIYEIEIPDEDSYLYLDYTDDEVLSAKIYLDVYDYEDDFACGILYLTSDETAELLLYEDDSIWKLERAYPSTSYEYNPVAMEAYIGNVKELPEIEDITGKWISIYEEEPVILVIKDDHTLALPDNSAGYMLDPRGSGFDVYDTGIGDSTDRVGYIEYGEDTDLIRITDLKQDKAIVFGRYYDDELFAGEWTLESVNGKTLEETAKEKNTIVEGVAVNLTFADNKMTYTDSEASYTSYVYIYSDNDFSVEIIRKGDYIPASCRYDKDSGKLTVTYYQQDEDTETEMVFVRGSYKFKY